MAEGVLGLELVLESQQHGEGVSPGAGGALGPTVLPPGKIAPHRKHSHAVLALPLKTGPKCGAFALLCVSEMML